nr:hypothetical protein [Ramlibacter montanisoli]
MARLLQLRTRRLVAGDAGCGVLLAHLRRLGAQQRFQRHQRRFAEHARQRPQQRRVDDAPQAQVARDAHGIDRDDAVARRLRAQLCRRVRGVHHDGRALVRPRQQRRLQQAGVEAEDGVGPFDVAAQPDRVFGHAQEGTHRRAAPRPAVGGEGLHLAAAGEVGPRQQVARGLGALPAASLDDDFAHRLLLLHAAVAWIC